MSVLPTTENIRALYLSKLADDSGYKDSDGRSVVMLVVHTDIPFEELSKFGDSRDCMGLMKALTDNCEFLSADVNRKIPN